MNSIKFNQYEIFYDNRITPIYDKQKNVIFFCSKDFKCLNMIMKINQQKHLEYKLCEEITLYSLSKYQKRIELT
ncbi:hypothetical protein M2S00_03850 [Apilactobacillus sp. TMW 2.2459]|uniref:Uncharacterized protein n=1 Tax=Apilactobacillus xinyiensis TaxID=2841032 RepID=A0ABT0I2B9_9LACO|nr:hypothetical protein [Apilactobacillus xinyiensis]MCK8624875.1 hypothetical protein [Apilactobacillus xinyiensis]MCL0312233.1 hypothetical protein [Apilactobacillus xinyiensis]